MKFIDYLYKNVDFNEKQGYALFYYHNGKIFEKCNGKLSDEESDDITFDSNFRLASVSKQFIAFAIVKLINEGLISYDTNILEIYSDFPKYFENITIKHLLTHTSGIYDYENMEHTEEQISDQDVLEFLKTTTTTYFNVGEKYQYSNTAYILLGQIVRQVSKRELDDFIEEEVFHKAFMFDSKVNYEGKTIVNNRAYGHVLVNNELIVKDQYWCSATIGDGGLYSSINDLKKWIKYLMKSNEYNAMSVPNITPNYSEYGLGIRIVNLDGKKIIYHSGSTIGTKTLLLFSKDLDLCLIFLSNFNDANGTLLKEKLIEYLQNKE